MQKMLDDITRTTAKVWASFQLFTGDDIRQFLSDFQIQVMVNNRQVDIKGLTSDVCQEFSSASETRHASQILLQCGCGFQSPRYFASR